MQNKFFSEKSLALVVPIRKGVAGQTKDGLILACQPDTMEIQIFTEQVK